MSSEDPLGTYGDVSLFENDVRVLCALEEAIGEPVPLSELTSEINILDGLLLKYLENTGKKSLTSEDTYVRHQYHSRKNRILSKDASHFGFLAHNNHVTSLLLANKAVTAVLDEIATLTHLEYLDLSGHHLLPFPSNLANLSSLQTLCLDLTLVVDNSSIILHDLSHLPTLMLIISPDLVNTLSNIPLPFSPQDLSHDVFKQFLENPKVNSYLSQGSTFNFKYSWDGLQIDKAVVKTIHLFSSRITLPSALSILHHCQKDDVNHALSIPLNHVFTLTSLLDSFRLFCEFSSFLERTSAVSPDADEEELIGLLKSSILPKLLEYYSVAVFMSHHRVPSTVYGEYVRQLEETIDNMKSYYGSYPCISTQAPFFSSSPEKIVDGVPFVSYLPDGSITACSTVISVWLTVKLGEDPLQHLPPDEAAVLKDFGHLFLSPTDPFPRARSSVPGLGLVTVEAGHVTELSLSFDRYSLTLPRNEDFPSGLGFHGLSLFYTLPPSISQLQHLKKLRIYGHPLNTLPDNFGQLVNLESLSLDFGLLSYLPDSFSNLSDLKELSLQGNRFITFPDVITSLVNLEKLDLSHNHISSCPSSIRHLHSLQKLFLQSNRLSSLPLTIGDLSMLNTLFLGSNNLSSLPMSLEELSRLKILVLDDNELSYLPSTISRLTNLEILSVCRNRLQYLDRVNLHTTLSELIQLQKLSLDDNLLKELPDDITSLPNLNSLSLDKNPLVKLPATIGRLPNVSGLSPSLQSFYDEQRLLYKSK